MSRWFAIGLVALISPELNAQEMDHSKMDHSKMDHSKMDHSKMDHSKMDHSKMDHSKMDHSKMDHSKMDPSKMDHSKMDHSTAPVSPIPKVSDADREAAFPVLHTHMHSHGTRVAGQWLIDRMEVADTSKGNALNWESSAWVGGDVQKFRFKTEGHAQNGEVSESRNELLYSRSLRAWWDGNVGVRVDAGKGHPSRTWLALGIEGLAPYKIETATTLYLGAGGRTALIAHAEYDTLLSPRLIVQWKSEAEVLSKDDVVAGQGKGVSKVSVGARMRYEISRSFAPYIGIEQVWYPARTGDLRRSQGLPVNQTQAVLGVRAWF